RLGGVGGWEQDLITGDFWYSQEMLRILDLPADTTMRPSETVQFIDEADRAAHEARIQLALEEKTIWESEFATTTQKGRHVIVRSLGQPIFENGHLVKMVGFVQDITEERESDRLIKETNERLSLIFDTLSEGVSLSELVRDEKGNIIDHRILEVNNAFYRIADYAKNLPVIGGLASELFQIPREFFTQFWAKHINSKEPTQIEYHSPSSGNHLIVTTSPLQNNQFITSFYDITVRKKQELEIKESEERHRKLIESIADAVFVHRDGVIQYANPSASLLLGAVSTQELVGRNVRDIVPLENRNAVLKQSPLQEAQIIRLNGASVAVEMSATEITFSGHDAILLVARDLSERKRAEEKIRYMGQHDQLTQLPNRLLLTDRILQAITFAEFHPTVFAVLVLDVDHFKKINDALGHHKGDLFLQEVAARLLTVVKSIDTLSRQGGDEFLILLNDLTEAKDAAQVAQKISQLFQTPFQIAESSITASTSIGIATYPHDGRDPETLIRNADIAMYHAKDSGRNQFQFYSSDLNRITHERLELETLLRTAIQKEELTVHYQPQQNLSSGEIESCEALLRWPHPERGFIPPGRFIPIAEETGLITEIGRWVLQKVAEDYKFFSDAGFDSLRISINASAKEIQDANFRSHIRHTVTTGVIPPSVLELEVTESMIMHDTAQAVRTIQELSDLGIRFSIDDFGTGYSSLSYLRELKIHNLKIDQSFVRDLTDDPDDAAIVRTIIGLAKNLRLQVIAEGVETEAQKRFLKVHGCDIIQGYELSPALSANDFVEFLQGKAVG
ncbi:MAG TPA: EAL domain-containing protein, partial [Turneriella sp.]|nr:EAL domain-containing protein [Turneriella sp.]